ncbi:MAG: hypothetical protein AB9835_00280 [Eubacteriales bacterium]
MKSFKAKFMYFDDADRAADNIKDKSKNIKMYNSIAGQSDYTPKGMDDAGLLLNGAVNPYVSFLSPGITPMAGMTMPMAGFPLPLSPLGHYPYEGYMKSADEGVTMTVQAEDGDAEQVAEELYRSGATAVVEDGV